MLDSLKYRSFLNDAFSFGTNFLIELSLAILTSFKSSSKLLQSSLMMPSNCLFYCQLCNLLFLSVSTLISGIMLYLSNRGGASYISREKNMEEKKLNILYFEHVIMNITN